MTAEQIATTIITILPILIGGGGLAAGIKLLAEARKINAETNSAEMDVQKKVKALYEELDTARREENQRQREEIQRLRLEQAAIRAECAENKTIMQGEIRQLTQEVHGWQNKYNAMSLENMDLRQQIDKLREQIHAFQSTMDQYTTQTADDLASRHLPRD